MGKDLSEMTLKELWDLFPIFLVQHDERWNEYYKEIEATITDALCFVNANAKRRRVNVERSICNGF